MAEKTSRFKVDTEGNNRNKSHANSRKGSREKRPSMISEMYQTGVGGRMRGSYGNVSRSTFGANRAVSLDQYSACNRRLSDGLQAVTSDNNVYYNQRQQRSLDNEAISENAIGNQTISENECKVTSIDAVSSEVDTNSDNLNKNLCIEERKQMKSNLAGKPLANTNTSANNGTKTFMSRLRQLTGRFSFSFDKDPKRSFLSAAQNFNNSVRNNNSSDSAPLTKSGGFCCTQRNASPLHGQRNELVVVATSTGGPNYTAVTSAAASRNRAYSLDVPVRTRYSSSNSGGGDSRKSSRNDDNNHIMLLMMEDNNSNQTTTIGDNKSDVVDGGESNAGSFMGGGGAGNST